MTTTFIFLKPPMHQNQHFISATDNTTSIIEITTIIRDSGNKNESVSPSPKASDNIPCCL